MLIYAGEKPATIIGIEPKGISAWLEEQVDSVEESKAELLGLLDAVELPYRIGSDVVFPERCNVFIGMTKEWMDRIYEANDTYELGLCFGYPETAVTAYLTGGSGDFKAEHQLRGGRTLGHFICFAPSNNSQEEEIKTPIRWHNTIKKLSRNVLFAELERFYRLA